MRTRVRGRLLVAYESQRRRRPGYGGTLRRAWLQRAGFESPIRLGRAALSCGLAEASAPRPYRESSFESRVLATGICLFLGGFHLAWRWRIIGRGCGGQRSERQSTFWERWWRSGERRGRGQCCWASGLGPGQTGHARDRRRVIFSLWVRCRSRAG